MNEMHAFKEFQETLHQLAEADELSGAVLVAAEPLASALSLISTWIWDIRLWFSPTTTLS